MQHRWAKSFVIYAGTSNQKLVPLLSHGLMRINLMCEPNAQASDSSKGFYTLGSVWISVAADIPNSSVCKQSIHTHRLCEGESVWRRMSWREAETSRLSQSVKRGAGPLRRGPCHVLAWTKMITLFKKVCFHRMKPEQVRIILNKCV